MHQLDSLNAFIHEGADEPPLGDTSECVFADVLGGRGLVGVGMEN